MVNDGIGNGNFTTLKPFAFWTQHVLPLVYGDEISYMETLGKMRDILNELIKNNNNLPEYIQRMIEEYISSGAIEEVIDKILSNFILNVKYPPTGVPKAKGDGTANDHDSIQGCIDYAAGLGGGVVYLPAGKYLTSSLVLKPGVTLLGFGRYATSLILAGGATTHLITGTVSDAGLVNLTLNAKMSSQVNRVDAVELVGNHIDIKNCIVKDCYTSINVQKTGSAINICDVICEVASDACLRIGGTDGGLLVDGLEMTGLSTNLGVAYIVTDSNGDIYRNINIHGTGALGIDVAGSQNYFDGKISGVTKDYEDLGGENTFELFGKCSVKNYTNDVVENANAFSQVAANGIERQGANISDNSTNTDTTNTKTKVINATDVIINSINPITYGNPENGYIEVKNAQGNIFKIPTKYSFLPSSFFGVKGDKTDESELLQNAINFCSQNSSILYIEPGKYVGISQPLIMPKDSYIKLDGYIYQLNPDFSYITNMDGNPHPVYSGNGNITIFGNGGFLGQGSALPNNTVSFFRFAHAENISLIGINVSKWGNYHAVEIMGCNKVLIQDVKFRDNENSAPIENYAEECIQIDICESAIGQGGAIPYDKTPSKHITISNCIFDNVDNPIGSQKGVETNFLHENIKIINNTFNNIKYACIMPFRYSNCVISGNIANNVGWGFIYPFSIEESCFYVTSIENNVCENICKNITSPSTDKFSFTIYNSDEVSIKDNIVSGCETGAIAMINCTRSEVSNNIFGYILTYNLKNAGAVYNCNFLQNNTDLNYTGNQLLINEGDIYSNSLVGNNPNVRLNFIGNSTNMNTTYNGYNKKVLSKVKEIFNGNKGVSTSVPITEPHVLLNVKSLVLAFTITGVGNFTEILDLDSYSGEVIISRVIASVNPEFYQINISFNKETNEFTITKSNKGTIVNGAYTLTEGTNDSDSPILLTKIYGVYGNNLTDFNSAFGGF